MTQELSKDISSLFDAYHVSDPRYKELSEKERYYKVKQKWPALKGVVCTLLEEDATSISSNRNDVAPTNVTTNHPVPSLMDSKKGSIE